MVRRFHGWWRDCALERARRGLRGVRPSIRAASVTHGRAMTTLITPLRRAVQVGASRTAARCGDEALSYAETWERCRRLVGRAARASASARATASPSSARTATATSSCTRRSPARAWCIVPLNQRHTEAELRYALEDSGARVLFTGIGDHRRLGDLRRARHRPRRRLRGAAGRRAAARRPRRRRRRGRPWPASSTRAARPAPPRA